MKFEKRVILVLAFFVFGSLIHVGFVSSSTYITDSYINTSNLNFNIDGGTFSQQAEILHEVGVIKDDSQGGLASHLDAPRGVFVLGGYAYVTSSSEDALTIFDVSNPSNMTQVGFAQDDSQPGGTIADLDNPQKIFVEGGYAYVGSWGGNTLAVLDVSNPSNISEVGVIKDDSVGGNATCLDKPLRVLVSGQYAYVLTGNDNALSIIDVSDPTNMTEVGCIKDDSVGGSATVFAGPRDIAIDGKYAYVASFTDSALDVVDISDPSNPFEVGYITDNSTGGSATALEGARGVYVKGNYAYVVSNVDSALSIIDISNKSNLSQVSYIQDNSLGGRATNLTTANFVWVAGNYAYVTSNGEEAISVFDISNASYITEIQTVYDDGSGGSFVGLNSPKDVFISGKYLYLAANGDDALTAVEISGFRVPALDAGSIGTTHLDVEGSANILNDLYVRNGIYVAFNAWIGGSLSIYKNLKVIGNITSNGLFVNNGNSGISGNFTDGNCWTAYSGGIVYSTNCTAY